MKAGSFLLLLASCVFLSPAAQAQSTDPNSIESQREISGFVRAAGSNRPIEGVIVRLESSVGELIQDAVPEGSGHFSFTGLLKTAYYVTAKAPGFREQRQRVDMNIMQHATISIFLIPEPDTNPAPPLSPVDQKYLQIPEPARREFEKASKLLKDKKPEESIAGFKKAISMYPDFPAAHFLLGTAYMDQMKWKEAQPSLEKAVQLDEKQGAAHLALGTCLAQQGNFAEAERQLRRGVELSPDSADGQIELAKVCLAQGKWQEAEPPTRKALSLKSDAPVAHVLLGNILLRKNDPKGALAEFNTYLKLDPNGPFAAKARDTVANLEKALPQKPQQP